MRPLLPTPFKELSRLHGSPTLRGIKARLDIRQENNIRKEILMSRCIHALVEENKNPLWTPPGQVVEKAKKVSTSKVDVMDEDTSNSSLK